MYKMEPPKAVKTWRVICAAQSEPDYSEDRQVLLYAGDYPCERKYMLLDGGHCSCFDWDEVEWSATVYDHDEIEALARSKEERGYYEESERMFWQMVRLALGIDREMGGGNAGML